MRVAAPVSMAAVPKSQVNLSSVTEAGMGTRLPVNAVRLSNASPVPPAGSRLTNMLDSIRFVLLPPSRR